MVALSWAAAAIPVLGPSAPITVWADSKVLTPVGQLQAHAVAFGHALPPPEAYLSVPLRSADPAALHAAKEQAARAQPGSSAAVSTPGASSQAPRIALFNGLNQPGLSAADESGCCSPPDTTGAVGPNHYIEIVNVVAAVYDRSLNPVASANLFNFAGTGSLAPRISDPQVEWDAQANRWLYAALPFTLPNGPDFIAFGWSKTADPSDLVNGWCRFVVNTGSLINDFPKLGHDDNFITIGVNVFNGSPFVTADIVVITKPANSDVSCTPPTVVHFADGAHPLLNADGSPAFTPVPANTADSSSVGYIVAAHSPLRVSPQTRVMVWHTMNSIGGAQLFADGDITVNSFGIPANVPQPGTSNVLDSSDARLTQAVAHSDPSAGGAEAVWTQHTIAGPGGRSVVQWYEFFPATLTVGQQGIIQSATDFVFNAAISSSSAGNDAAIAYNRGSASQLPLIASRSRRSSTPANTMDATELVLGTSTASDVDFTCTATSACRWGDYAGATPDFSNASVIWFSNQLVGAAAGSNAAWTTRNFAVTTAIRPSVTGVSPNTGPVGGGTAVTITGANLGGASAVHFGTVAASISSNTATQITVVSPAAATPGVVDVTVTTIAGTSPVATADQFTYGGIYTRVSTQQYKLTGSNGSTWVDMDPGGNLTLVIIPSVDSTVILTANADLWTANAGINQDIGIDVNGTIVAWKESGGFAGTFSPNAAFVQTVVSMTAGTGYTVTLRWKTNKNAPGATIFAGAGGGAPFSPTRLSGQLLPASAGSVRSAFSTKQYKLADSNGAMWMDVDATNLSVTLTPSSNLIVVIGGNADLWTANAGINQDIGIDVNGTIVAWKESGGFAGTFSPNAAFVQSVQVLTASTPYTIKLRWKANKPAAGATIFIGAGASAPFSPTGLTLQLYPASASVPTKVSTLQYHLAGNDGNTWIDLDANGNLTLFISPGVNTLVFVSGNVDLWTASAGINQDIGIDVNGTIVAWKESGGFAGTFSPNAAYVQVIIPLTGSSNYTIKLRWKTNKATAGTIFAAAGTSPTFSPTSLTVQFLTS